MTTFKEGGFSSLNKMIAQDKGIRIFKGVYLGITKKDEKKYCHAQFEGMLRGKNRILDAFINTETDDFPEFYEVDKMQKGKDAFLFLLNYDFSESISGKYFINPDEIEKPELLYDIANLDKTKMPDTCFFIALKYHYDYYNSKKSIAISNIYNKTSDNNYSVRQIRSECNQEHTGKHFHLNYVYRNKTQKKLDKLKYGLTVPADIITSPFQLLGAIYIGIFGI